jgi:bifunctional UDP-N-acetylglucosamine pyrophosphorylase/glucosamine-1-phosphate N-acetyltransferase
MNQAIILAGGQGKRMHSNLPKPLLKVLNEPMLEWVIRACEEAGIERICVVKGFGADKIEEYLGGRCATVMQEKRLGTGHAVMQALDFIKEDKNGSTIVLCGDAPFIDAKTIKESLEFHEARDNAVTVITAEIDNPYGYGRILRNNDDIIGIVEEKDASDTQKTIKEINSGCYWFKSADMPQLLSSLTRNNVQNEYYLTDTIYSALTQGMKAGAFKSENKEVILGANDRKGMLKLNEIARANILEKHMENGVAFSCTDGIVIGRDVEIKAGTEILPGTIIKGKTKIGADCVIGPNCLIENSEIGDNVILNSVQSYDSVVEDNVKIGPFVQLRPNSHICKGVKIGDFVEIKNSTIGENTAVAHLTYVGDSDVGKKVNFGCGVVTVNYDGIHKNRCKIGDGCFIGCNTNLIAPVTLGDGVYTAAGSTITADVQDYALVIERGHQIVKENYSLAKLGSRIEKK